MAATQYQIFYRYLNENINRALTNQTDVDWISAEELTTLKEYHTANSTEYNRIKTQLLSGALKENQLSVVQIEIYTTCRRYEELDNNIKKKKVVTEYCIVEPADSLYQDQNGRFAKDKANRDLELYEYVVKEARADNPKYDMVFMYDGIASAESRNGLADYHPPQNDDKQVPYVHYDRMKRIKLDPWFLHSTHGSLESAMKKAKTLVNILGKNAVKVGKVVPLEQYIEII